MKRLGFLETKRTPRYSLRKFSVGMASVLLGVTIFGINFTNHSVKAANIESVETNTQKATSATEKVQQSSASNNATANNSTEAMTTSQSATKTQGSADTDIKSLAVKLAATNLMTTSGTYRNAATTESVENSNSSANSNSQQTNTQKATSATEKIQQSSASNNATANNSTEAATTSQSAPKTQGSADTGIKSSTAKSVVKLAATNLVAMQSNKPAKENQVATEDKINWGAIKYKTAYDNDNKNIIGVEITGWDITKGGYDITKGYYDVVLPNTADFVKKGIITEKQAAYVSGDDLHNIFLTLASTKKDFTITISHNTDSKLSDSRLHVKPTVNYYNIGSKGDLSSAFGTYSEHNNGTDTHYQNNLTKADLANLDVSNVYDMSNMFWNAAKLKEVDLTGWQTNSVRYFNSMFFGTKQLSDLKFTKLTSYPNEKYGASLMQMFDGSGIKNLDLSTWNVSNVADFTYMFDNTKNLNVLNISGWKLNKTVEFNGNPNPVSGLFLFGRGADNSSVRTIIANDTDLNGHYLQAFKQSHPMEIISNTDKPIFIKGNFVIKDPTKPSSIGSPNFVYVIFVDKQTGEIITKDPYAQVKRPVRDAADQLQAFKDAIRASYDKLLKAKGYEIKDKKAFKVVDGQDSKAQLATELDKLVDNYYDSSKNPTIMWKVYLSHKKTTIYSNDVPEGMNKDDFVKTVKRVINITDPQTNQTKTITQEVTFTRSGFLDEVTKGLTYGDWSEDGKHTFDKIDVPTIPGYTPSQETIDSLVVTPDTDSNKTTVNITYSKNSADDGSNYYSDMTGNSSANDGSNYYSDVTGNSSTNDSSQITGQDKYVSGIVMFLSKGYDKFGNDTGSRYVAYSSIKYLPTIVEINGKTYYKLADKDQYVRVINITGKQRILKRNAYVYNNKGQRIGLTKFTKGKELTTYGKQIALRDGKKYYRIARGQYVKAINFRAKLNKK